MNHLQSLKFESKLYAMVKDKMEEMQQHNMSWIEVQFLKKSLDILCECRRTLMYTYVFAYYLRKNHQQEIFEVKVFIDWFNSQAMAYLGFNFNCLHKLHIHFRLSNNNSLF